MTAEKKCSGKRFVKKRATDKRTCDETNGCGCAVIPACFVLSLLKVNIS